MKDEDFLPFGWPRKRVRLRLFEVDPGEWIPPKQDWIRSHRRSARYPDSRLKAREGHGVQFYPFDAPYVEQLRSGDKRTEEHFVGYFRELIQLKLRSRLKSKEAIEDVEQETFARVLSALRSQNGLRRADRLGAYVNSVCNNVLLEHYRSERRTESMESLDEGAAATLAAKSPDAFALVVNKEIEAIVRATLEKLTDRDRCLLGDVLLREQDKNEVCRRLGVDREYLRVLLHRAKQSFKSFLLDHPPTADFSGGGRRHIS